MNEYNRKEKASQTKGPYLGHSFRKELTMQNNFQYIEKDLLGGWVIEVRKGLAHIGNIRKNQIIEKFHYYSGPNNQLNPSFEEATLDALKQKIETNS